MVFLSPKKRAEAKSPAKLTPTQECSLRRAFGRAIKRAKRLERDGATEKIRKQAAFKRRVLDADNHDPNKQLNLRAVVTRIVALAQTLAEKKFYPYQVELSYRIVESLLLHDGDVITALISRQSGKTECLSGTVLAAAIILPILAKRFPEDWRLNTTDEQGVYRGFRDGLKVGIYAPREEQADIMFNRIRVAIDSDTGKQVLKEANLKKLVSNGDRVRFSNGSRVMCQSASEQSKIEGETHHLLICEEAQDLSDIKVRKSLHPMVSSVLGTIAKIGTASTRKCDFYNAIKINERAEVMGGRRNHFFYPHTVTERYNSQYRKYVAKQRDFLGEDSDEFRMAYKNEWIFERGMFITQSQLFAHSVAATEGLFSFPHPRGLHKNLRYFSIVVGIDWGASSDSTVVTTMAVNWRQPLETGEYQDANGVHPFVLYKKHVLNWMEFLGDNYETQFHEIVAYLRTLPGLKKIVMDSNTCGQPIFDRFSALFAGSGIEVVPFNFQAKLKSDGYKALYGDFCARRITFPACYAVCQTGKWRKFVNQMLDLRKEYRNGLMCVSHPEEKGAHDDYPDSLMLAAWGAGTESHANTIEVMDGNPFY